MKFYTDLCYDLKGPKPTFSDQLQVKNKLMNLEENIREEKRHFSRKPWI